MLKTDTRSYLVTRILAFTGLLAFILAVVALPLSAQSLNQGYNSDEVLQIGMLVKEKDDDPSAIELVNQDTLEDLKGVVVEKNNSPIVIASEDQSVFVANSGTQEVLVSDENGGIKRGDYLSISSIAGIAMKAGSEQSIVLGRAADSFSGNGDSIGSTTREFDGKQVNLGRIQTDIAIASNPLYNQARQSTIPKVLKNISSSVAGEPVSNARIWLSVIVFLVTSFVTGVMLYAGSKSSLLAIGRNPLSKTPIIRGLLQVVVLGLIVFISGMFGVYLLLKL